MSRKGISPIIASVLLLAVALSVVGVFSGWAPQLAQDVTESTENSTMETIACNEAGLEIRSAYHNGSELTVNLRNSGSEDLDDIAVVAYDDNESIMDRNQTVSVNSGDIKDTSLSDVGSPPARVEALSGDCTSVTTTTTDIE